MQSRLLGIFSVIIYMLPQLLFCRNHIIYLESLVNETTFELCDSVLCVIKPTKNQAPLCSMVKWPPSTRAESIVLCVTPQNRRFVCVLLKASSQFPLSVTVVENWIGWNVKVLLVSSFQALRVPALRGINTFSAKSFWGIQIGKACLLNVMLAWSFTNAMLLSLEAQEYFV